MDVSSLSDHYNVRRLCEADAETVYSLCRNNSLYYQYYPPFVTKKSILEDMYALPPGKEASDKYYIGYFDNGSLVAVMDLILAYPDNDTAFIGFFMMDTALQNIGIGSRIIQKLCSRLADNGFNKVRLAWAKGNPQAEHFWHKNSFYETGNAHQANGHTVVVAQRILSSAPIRNNTEALSYITLRDQPDLIDSAAEWFHGKWSAPKEAYLECMTAYLTHETEYGWYLCLDRNQIVSGMGVIENDFHDRKDLTPNVCAVYTEKAYRNRGIAGRLLNMVVEDMRSKGIAPLYLLTDHTGFYERYGWEFFCMAQGEGEAKPSRMYVHW